MPITWSPPVNETSRCPACGGGLVVLVSKLVCDDCGEAAPRLRSTPSEPVVESQAKRRRRGSKNRPAPMSAKARREEMLRRLEDRLQGGEGTALDLSRAIGTGDGTVRDMVKGHPWIAKRREGGTVVFYDGRRPG